MRWTSPVVFCNMSMSLLLVVILVTLLPLLLFPTNAIVVGLQQIPVTYFCTIKSGSFIVGSSCCCSSASAAHVIDARKTEVDAKNNRRKSWTTAISLVLFSKNILG